MTQSIEEFFITCLQKSSACAKLDDDVFVFSGSQSPTFQRHSFPNPCISTSKSLPLKYYFVSAADGFCEDIHFKRDWFSPYMLAYKAFLVNISDFIAKNATPTLAIISLVIARDMKKSSIKEIVSGFNDVCHRFGIKIVGGDTMLGDKLAFHITLFGSAYKPISRLCKKDSLLFCTQGMAGIGSSLKTLRALLRFKSSHGHLSIYARRVLNNASTNYANAQNRFYFPLPRTRFMESFGKYIGASMDISDGLAQDIPKLLASKHLALMPSKTFSRFQKGGQKWRLQSGEEYEVLFSIHARHKHALKRISCKTRTKILFLGKLKRGKCRLHSQKWH